jgi:DNA-directed RNA polymerase specialized sigma24 family protein
MPLACLRVCPRRFTAALLGAVVAAGFGAGPAAAQIGPQTVVLVNRLCAQTLRTNEEDRLYGMISLAVRATIRYRGGELRPDIIDDAVQDSLDGMIEDCPELTEADESKRVTMAIEMIADATTKVLEEAKQAQATGDKDNPYMKRSAEKATAADLSQELSSHEIDQWLEAMPPRQRALSLFLYASDVTPQEIAAATGEPAAALTRQFNASKADLMRIFREEWAEPAAGPRTAPAMQYRTAGEGFTAVMKAAAAPSPAAEAAPAAPDPGPAADPAADPGPAADPAADPAPGPRGRNPAEGLLPSLRVTGISDDLYAGWSLIATGRNLVRGQRLSIAEPVVLQPDNANGRRMLVVDIAELGDPDAPVRHFLLKAYAIDAEKEAAGLHDSFHVGAPLDNPEAKKTLANPGLSSIEIARCLWRDFGTGQDPGLCRDDKQAGNDEKAAPAAQ